MLKVVLIRHGATEGNMKKRYIGRIDERLCEKGREQIEQNVRANKYPAVDCLYVSPMKRCIETAKIIYPELELNRVEELRECDFGEFEGKNYEELSGNAMYQAWIDSNGALPFPKGESREQFHNRCIKGIETILEKHQTEDITIGFVIHGGVIMSILEEFAETKESFYSWQISNGEGYMVSITKENQMKVEEVIK